MPEFLRGLAWPVGSVHPARPGRSAGRVRRRAGGARRPTPNPARGRLDRVSRRGDVGEGEEAGPLANAAGGFGPPASRPRRRPIPPGDAGPTHDRSHPSVRRSHTEHEDDSAVIARGSGPAGRHRPPRGSDSPEVWPPIAPGLIIEIGRGERPGRRACYPSVTRPGGVPDRDHLGSEAVKQSIPDLGFRIPNHFTLMPQNDL